MRTEPSRRKLLQAAGLAGLAAVVTACTGGSGKGRSTSTSGSQAASTTSPTSTAASTAGSAPASRPTYAALHQQLSGRLATPGQSGYRPDALLYNPRFTGQAKPSAIAHVASPDDVRDCVRFAGAGGASLRIRNGGHSYGGWSSGPGLVVDLAGLDDVRVDHDAMTATIGAGALLGHVYEKLDAAGVSIGAGSCATVGITGLTLGGGVGLLTRALRPDL